MVRATGSKLFVATFLVALAVSSVGAAIGWSSVGSGGDPLWADGEGDIAGDLGFGTIAARNLGAALLLFSGVATAGLTTVLTLGMVGLYVGATFAAASGGVGSGAALSSILLYAPVEFAGLLLAATAGLLPVVSVLGHGLARRTQQMRSGFATYGETTSTSLRVLGAAAVVVLSGAAIETVVLMSR